jgi:hypothetical protein
MSFTTVWKLNIVVSDPYYDNSYKYKYYHSKEELLLSQKYNNAKEAIGKEHYTSYDYDEIDVKLYNDGKFKKVRLLEFQLS